MFPLILYAHVGIKCLFNHHSVYNSKVASNYTFHLTVDIKLSYGQEYLIMEVAV